MKKTWSKVEAELATKARAILESMNPGAEEAAIEELEEHIGQELPTDYRDFLMMHDGQGQESNPGFFDMFSLMPLELVQDSWNEVDTLREDVGEHESCPGDWLPIAEDGTGDLLCVELESGAISKFVHDEANEEIADSFEGWLAEMLGVLRGGDFLFDSSSGSGIEPRTDEGHDDDDDHGDDDEERIMDADGDSDSEATLTYKFTAKAIDVFEDGEKMASVPKADIVRVRVSSYAGDPLVSISLPEGSDPEELELPNSADLQKFLAKLKGWDKDAFTEATTSTKSGKETVVWGS